MVHKIVYFFTLNSPKPAKKIASVDLKGHSVQLHGISSPQAHLCRIYSCFLFFFTLPDVFHPVFSHFTETESQSPVVHRGQQLTHYQPVEVRR